MILEILILSPNISRNSHKSVKQPIYIMLATFKNNSFEAKWKRDGENNKCV